MLTGEGVWETVSNHPKFMEEEEPFKIGVRSFIESLPDILAEMLSTNATRLSVAHSRLLVLRAYCDRDVVKDIIAAIPDGLLSLSARNKRRVLEGARLKGILELNQQYLEDYVTNHTGPTYDSSYMLGHQIALKGTARDLYVDGQLTIGGILEHQPLLLLTHIFQ